MHTVIQQHLNWIYPTTISPNKPQILSHQIVADFNYLEKRGVN